MLLSVGCEKGHVFICIVWSPLLQCQFHTMKIFASQYPPLKITNHTSQWVLASKNGGNVSNTFQAPINQEWSLGILHLHSSSSSVKGGWSSHIVTDGRTLPHSSHTFTLHNTTGRAHTHRHEGTGQPITTTRHRHRVAPEVPGDRVRPCCAVLLPPRGILQPTPAKGGKERGDPA